MPPPPSAITGARAVRDALLEEGVEYFFNLPGNGLYPLLVELFDTPQISYVLGLHEASVVSMADGYARASGRVAFANTYMVPGTANAMSAIHTAWWDRSPVVITSTQQATTTVGRDAYASASDLVGMVRQFTKWSWEVTRPERLPEALHRAFKIAATEPTGPVYLSIPFDLLVEQLDVPLTEPSRPSAVPRLGAPDGNELAKLADALLNAERVLLIGGRDVVVDRAFDLLVELATELGAAVMNEPWNGVVAVPQPHPLAFGEYNRVRFDRIDPDVVVSIGARTFVEALGRPEPAFPDKVSAFAVGHDAEQMGRMYPLEGACVCDVATGLAALLHSCRGRVDRDRIASRLNALAEYQSELNDEATTLLRDHHDAVPMSLPRLAIELNKVIDPDTVVLEQATTSAGMLKRYLHLPTPLNVISTGGSTQGWGLGAAIGAQLGRPDQRVLGIIGDGGFVFNCQATWSAGRYGVPVTIIVLNNGGYRSMRRGVHHRMQEETAVKPDFGFDFDLDVTTIARAMGVTSDRIAEPAQIADVVKSALEDDAPHVIEIDISPEMNFVTSQGAPMAL